MLRHILEYKFLRRPPAKKLCILYMLTIILWFYFAQKKIKPIYERVSIDIVVKKEMPSNHPLL